MKFELLFKKIFYMCSTSYALILEVKLQFGCKYKDFFCNRQTFLMKITPKKAKNSRMMLLF